MISILAQAGGGGGGGGGVGGAAANIEAKAHEAGAEIGRYAQMAQDVAVQYGGRVVGAIVVLVAVLVLSRWVRILVYRGLNRPKMDQTLAKFFSNLAKWAVLAFGLLAVLNMLGISTTSAVAVIGAAGLAVGLALQGTLANFAAGVLLLIFRPFKIGDVVNVAGQAGAVDEIDFLSTSIDTPDGRRVIIPNNQVFGSVIVNESTNATRTVGVTVVVDGSHGIEKTREALLAAARGVQPRVEAPAPTAVPIDLAGGGVQWRVEVSAKSGEAAGVKPVLVQAVKEAMERAGLTGPTPGLNVAMRNL